MYQKVQLVELAVRLEKMARQSRKG
ncbi:MAG: hypothetical protein ACD_5C00010G0005, partial [uncultured bacterium]